MELVEGIRLFQERYSIKDFIDTYTDLQDNKPQNIEVVPLLFAKYESKDEHILRARTFIMSCISSKNFAEI